jgi:hypothetical protein
MVSQYRQRDVCGDWVGGSGGEETRRRASLSAAPPRHRRHVGDALDDSGLSIERSGDSRAAGHRRRRIRQANGETGRHSAYQQPDAQLGHKATQHDDLRIPRALIGQATGETNPGFASAITLC